MASFAKIGLNNKVIEVQSVVNEVLHDSNGVEQETIGIDFLNKLTGYPIWVQTSYNTHGNQHPQGKPLRGNYAGIGYTYDSDNNVFYAPQPYPSWILNNTTWLWEAPVAMPTDGKLYYWDEVTASWDLIEEEV
jgi:hypothetical protein